jgi:hypothetical protein
VVGARCYVAPTAPAVGGGQQLAIKEYPTTYAADQAQLVDTGNVLRDASANAAELSATLDGLVREIRLIGHERGYQGRLGDNGGERYSAVKVGQIGHCSIRLPAQAAVVGGEQY